MSVSKAFFLRLACKVQITKEAGLLIIIIIASNNQGLRSLGRQRSKVKTLLLQRSVLCRFRATDSQNMRDQITRGRRSKHGWSHCLLCIPFILSGSPNKLLAIYMRRMRNNNLEIKIAGSSYRPVRNYSIIENITVNSFQYGCFWDAALCVRFRFMSVLLRVN